MSRRILRLIVIVFAVLAAYHMTSPPTTPQKGWTTLSNVRFVEGRHTDGDSIEAIVDGQHYVFRLYFVDTIETSPTAFERREEQGAYFGDPPLTETETLSLARKASQLTRDTLSRGFVVHTRWEPVNPDSDNPSIRAFITTPTGQDLAEILVSHGLALIKGQKAQADHPDGRNARQIEETLVALEASAREQKLGGWALRSAPRRELPTGVFLATETQALKQQVGKIVSVQGRVSRVGQTAEGRMLFINFDGTGRDGFVGLVREQNERWPPGLPEGFPAVLTDKKVELRGRLELYHGTPQIEVERGDQLKVLE